MQLQSAQIPAFSLSSSGFNNADGPSWASSSLGLLCVGAQGCDMCPAWPAMLKTDQRFTDARPAGVIWQPWLQWPCSLWVIKVRLTMLGIARQA